MSVRRVVAEFVAGRLTLEQAEQELRALDLDRIPMRSRTPAEVLERDALGDYDLPEAADYLSDVGVRRGHQLEKAMTTAFADHDDAPILLSQPGLGTVPSRPPARGARRRPNTFRLRPRPASVRWHRPHHPGLRDHARGVRPAVRNRRLAQVSYQWAFSLLTASPRCPSALRPTPRSTRRAQRCWLAPGQPALEHRLALPADPDALRGGRRLPRHQCASSRTT